LAGAALAHHAASAPRTAHRHGAGVDGADGDRQLWLSSPDTPYSIKSPRRRPSIGTPPIARRIALARATVADLDARIGQFDAMVSAATGRGWTKIAIPLVGRQGISRATEDLWNQSAPLDPLL
jgi:hypothetical protein